MDHWLNKLFSNGIFAKSWSTAPTKKNESHNRSYHEVHKDESPINKKWTMNYSIHQLGRERPKMGHVKCLAQIHGFAHGTIKKEGERENA